MPVPAIGAGTSYTGSQSIDKNPPFALSLSKGFDKLSPNGFLCD